MFVSDAGGEHPSWLIRQLIAIPSVARWQWQIMQMREQARIRQRDGIERRAVARAAHHYQIRPDPIGKGALLRQRREVMFGSDQ